MLTAGVVELLVVVILETFGLVDWGIGGGSCCIESGFGLTTGFGFKAGGLGGGGLAAGTLLFICESKVVCFSEMVGFCDV